MPLKYGKDDIFYDVESLSNVFTVAWWYPNPDVNAIILSYLDDDNILKNNENSFDYIKEKIYKQYPQLKKRNTQIFFEDISKTGYVPEYSSNGQEQPGLQTMAKRMGLASNLDYLNATIDERGTEGTAKYDAHYFPVKDTDPDFDKDLHGFRFGYNSINYDMTMMSQLLGRVWDRSYSKEGVNEPIMWNTDTPVTARLLRDFNDELFSSEWIKKMPMRLAHVKNNMIPNSFGDFKKPEWILRKSWQLTGRHIDVSRLNERPIMIGLKRLLGMLGLQIMESDKLTHDSKINNLEEMAELLTYNISDVVNLQTLFEHNIYQNSFNVRKDLLETYPQTVYGQKKGRGPEGAEAQVDTGNYTNIRRDRLVRDSTSAKFVELSLAPYNPIKDIRTVSFMYPSKQEALRLDIPQTDILEDTLKYFEENVTDDKNDNAHKDFMQVYEFYDSIRGRNYNQSDVYKQDYLSSEKYEGELEPMQYEQIRDLLSTYNTNLFYHRVNRHGQPYRSSCLANFSVGGIHGAEVNMKLWQRERLIYQFEKDMQDHVENRYQSKDDMEQIAKANEIIEKVDPKDAQSVINGENAEEILLEINKRTAGLAIHGPVWISLPDEYPLPERLKGRFNDKGEIKIREFLKGGSTKKKAVWREVKDVSLFEKKPSGSFAIRDKYKYVSVGPSHHEDFTSYYPLLLARLGVFINPSYHGYEDDAKTIPKDPYNEMFLERIATRKIARDETQDDHTREMADMEQESRKLLINAATGAGDTMYDNNIRANNGIMSMRIIGQLFAWRIGQAQSLAGARVPSTNTDGLYTMDITAEENDRILMETAKDMHIQIEPERLDRFVSKDSNNRLEVYQGEIKAASGGTLNSWNGPQPAQSLDHAAIIDHILVKYLADERIDNPADIPFDKEFARGLFNGFIKEHLTNDTPHEALLFFQWIVAGSNGTHRHPYLKIVNKNTGHEEIKNLQLINRIFLVKEDNVNERKEMYLATQRKVAIGTWRKRMEQVNSGELTRSELREHNPDAMQILKANGLNLLEENKHESSEYFRSQASSQKVRAMPDGQHIRIFNNDLITIPKQQAVQMIQLLDIDAYVGILQNTFKTWSNVEE